MLHTLYRYHQWLALVLTLPLLVWTLSALLHPLMRISKPQLAQHTLPRPALEAQALRLTPKQALTQNAIHTFENINLIKLNSAWFYQVALTHSDERIYLNTQTGQRLHEGDRLYAQYLARQYLGDTQSAITSSTLISAFNSEYGPINRLLPVWRIDFARDDHLRLYIQTQTARLASAVDDRRALQQWLFTQLHTWRFLGANNPLRITLFISAMLLFAVIALSGVLLYGASRSRSRLMQWHRVLGLLVSLSALAWALSGALHAYAKFTPDTRHLYRAQEHFTTQDLNDTLPGILAATTTPVYEIALIRLNAHCYYRLDTHRPTPRHTQHNTPAPTPRYVNAQDATLLAQGDRLYARALATRFSGIQATHISAVETITHFNTEYGFIDKRLPVIKVQFDTQGQPRYYIETRSSQLASRVDRARALESGVFRYLHKWDFAKPLGLNTRDMLITLFIITNSLVMVLGLLSFLSKHRKAKPTEKTQT